MDPGATWPSDGILGTSMLWFAARPDGTPLRPEHWRAGCLATVGTHDLPPVSAFLTGEQVTVRARLGLLKLLGGLERQTQREADLPAGWTRSRRRD